MKVKKILISNGPTKVFLDPVRYISNISTGLMGLCLTKVALSLGYEVVVVSGHTEFHYPDEASIISAVTNDDMLFNLKKWFAWSDIFISVAAVVDFAPCVYSDEKLKTGPNDFKMSFSRTIDILKTLSCKKRDNQTVVGFALETESLLNNAISKMKDKNLDFIIANLACDSMGKTDSKATILGKNGLKVELPRMEKSVLAEKIFEVIV